MRIDKLLLTLQTKAAFWDFGLFVFGLVADIALQVELTSAKTPLSEQGDVKEEEAHFRYATDD
ncbi:MAG: hypothetical protein ACLU37_03275 [Collinsella sp.]